MTTTTATITEVQADNFRRGVTTDGEEWSVARYGTLIVENVDGDTEDWQFATEAQAAEEFEVMVFELQTA